MIEVKNLTKQYGDRLAIDSLNFMVKKGEVVGLLGPNGAGKSTTMKIITGHMAATSGQAIVNGFDVFEEPLKVKKMIGYLPETPPLYLDMQVKDYLSFVAKLKGCKSADIDLLVKRALEKTNLTEVSSRMIQNLSKGFKQRVGIAQALVSDPEILILDEPTVGLDPKQVAEIRSLIQSLKGEHTIILSTHILPEVQASCEKIIIINEGVIVAQDSIDELKNSISGTKKLHLRLRETNGVKQKVESIEGVVKASLSGKQLNIDFNGNDSTVEEISNLIVNEKMGLLEMNCIENDLESVFINLTSRGPQ